MKRKVKTRMSQKIDVLDVIIEVLKEHEKNLDATIDELETIITTLKKILIVMVAVLDKKGNT